MHIRPGPKLFAIPAALTFVVAAHAQFGPAITKQIVIRGNTANMQIRKKPAIDLQSSVRKTLAAKASSDNQMIKLKNGRTVRYADYRKSTEDLEHRLNVYGLSLTKSEVVPQPDANVSFFSNMPQQLKSMETRSRQNVQYSGASGAVASRPRAKQSKGGAPPPAPVLGSDPDKMQTVTLDDPGPSFTTTCGPKVLNVYLRGGAHLHGSSTFASDSRQYIHKVGEFNADVYADLGVNFFGADAQLFDVSGEFSGSDSQNKVGITGNVNVLGVTVYSPSDSFEVGYSASNAFSRSFDVSTPTTIPLGPFTVGMKAGLRGAAGLDYGYTLNCANIQGHIDPHVHVEAYFEVDYSLSIGIASADVGVEGSLVLVDDTLSISANAGVNYHSGLQLTSNGINDKGKKGFFFDRGILVTNQISGFSGKVDVFATATAFGFDLGTDTFTLFDWKGFSDTRTIYNSEGSDQIG